MHLGVAVDLAGAGHEEAGVVRPGQLEQPAGALAPHGQGVEGPGQIGRRRGRGGQVGHGVDRAVVLELDLLADVGHDEAEALMAQQMGHIVTRAGGEVVEADDGIAPDES